MKQEHRKFTLERCLGEGGFGEVYQAQMSSPGGLSTKVAVKIIRSELKPEPQAIRRLRDEGRALGHLDHPAVVKAFDLITLAGRLALVTEYVAGSDLKTVIYNTPRIAVRPVLEVVSQVADALAAAYTTVSADGEPLKLVHRDVKPSNIRIGRHGQVKLLDFGIARFEAEDREARTASDVVLGTLPYMAPERFVERLPRPQGDIFALGCCLFEGLAGERLFLESKLHAMSALALNERKFHRTVRARMALLAPHPKEIRRLIEAMVSHDFTERPSAQEVAREAEAAAEACSGASLRRWCADYHWPEPRATQGTLEGRVLTEGTLSLPPIVTPTVSEGGATGGPQIRHVAQGTIDPSVFIGASLASKNKKGGKLQAPPAFPSIPLGMALEEAQISQEEVKAALGEEKRAAELKRAPGQRLSTPVVIPAARPASKGKLIGAVGCVALLVFAVGSTVIAAAMGVLAYSM